MDKEIIKEKLKIKIELLKIYTILLVGLVTGDATILLKDLTLNLKLLILFILGTLALLIVAIMFFNTFLRIKKLKLKL